MHPPDRAPDEIDFLSIDDDTGTVKVVERWVLTPEEKAQARVSPFVLAAPPHMACCRCGVPVTGQADMVAARGLTWWFCDAWPACHPSAGS